MIDTSIVLSLDFRCDELSVDSGLMNEVIHELNIGGSSFGSLIMQRGSILLSDGVENATIAEYGNGVRLDNTNSVLSPESLGCTLGGSHPQFRVPFGVDGESKLARENAKEEQIWI